MHFLIFKKQKTMKNNVLNPKERELSLSNVKQSKLKKNKSKKHVSLLLDVYLF